MIDNRRYGTIKSIAIGTPGIITFVEIHQNPAILCVCLGEVEIPATAIRGHAVGCIFKGEEEIILIDRIGSESHVFVNRQGIPLAGIGEDRQAPLPVCAGDAAVRRHFKGFGFGSEDEVGLDLCFSRWWKKIKEDKIFFLQG